MRSRFFLFPAAIVAAAPAHAENFLSVEQAQALLFPGATMTPADYIMSEREVDQLTQATGATVYRAKVLAWHASTGGWFFVDQVLGRDDRVTYALALDEKGAVRGIEILVGLADYGAIRTPEWQRHLIGQRYGEGQAEPVLVSGQTLTTAHVSDGVSRLLATYAMFIAPRTLKQ
jgi:hypothetical protein